MIKCYDADRDFDDQQDGSGLRVRGERTLCPGEEEDVRRLVRRQEIALVRHRRQLVLLILDKSPGEAWSPAQVHGKHDRVCSADFRFRTWASYQYYSTFHPPRQQAIDINMANFLSPVLRPHQ